MSGKAMVLDEKEFQRLLSYSDGSAFNLRDSHDEIIKRDLQERFGRSQKATGEWFDTKENIRRARLQALETKRTAEEEQKVAQDVEEAEYRSRKRAEAMLKVKEYTRSQLEPVRKLNSALALTRCLRERENQIKWKIEKQREHSGADRQFYQKIVEDNAKLEEEMKTKVRRKREIDLQLERELKKQMEAKENRRLEEINQERKRAENLRLEDEMYVEKLRKQMAEEAERKKGFEMLSSATKEEARVRHQRCRQIEIDEERRIGEYESRKESDRRERLTVLEEEKRKREAMLERVSEAYAKLMKEKDHNYQTMELVREELPQIDDSRNKTREIRKREILEHFRMKVEERAREQRETQLRKIEERKKVDEALEVFEKECQEKTRERAKKNKINQEHILRQIEEKRQKEELERREKMRYEKELLNKIEEEQEEFQSYVQRVLQKAASERQPVYPILKVAASSRPSSAWKKPEN